MKRTGLVLLVVSLAMLFTGGSSAQGGFEWNHWDIGEALDYTTGKSALASALDAIEGAGWEVRFVVPRPRGGYSVVGRGAKGLHIPQPIESPQGYDYYYGGTAVSVDDCRERADSGYVPGHAPCLPRAAAWDL